MAQRIYVNHNGALGGSCGMSSQPSTVTRLVSFELHYFGTEATARRVVMSGTITVEHPAYGINLENGEKIIAEIQRKAMAEAAKINDWRSDDPALYQVVITHQFEL